MPRFAPSSPLVTLLRTAGTALVAGLFLVPRVLQAEEVSDEERHGEWEDGGERFGDIVVHGELVESPSAPGGWTLVRTYENTGDVREHRVVEERVMRTDTMVGARVGPAAVPVVVRTQVLDLAPHEKKAIGTYLPAAVAADMTKARRTELAAQARGFGGNETYGTFVVDYLRPLAKGEVAARPANDGRIDRMPMPPKPVEDVAAAPAAPAKLKPTARTIRGEL